MARQKRDDGKNAQTVASNKYQAANYERLNILLKKGERGKVRAHAAKHGETVNSLINRLLSQEIPEFIPVESKTAGRDQVDTDTGST